ncbi:MAG: helix-turn-helix domain-containing protein [Rhodobacteraceae bacterium]|nr:helix-turn-helix domain-containing protein [Paracoccaceae bacterium]
MLHDNIKAARERAGLSLSAAAERIGLGKTTLYRLEAGEAPIAASRLPLIALAYRTTVADLIDNRVKERTAEQDLLEIALVVQMVEEVIQQLDIRPNPGVVGGAVSETVRLARDDFEQRLSGEFDPNRYRAFVQGIFGSWLDRRPPVTTTSIRT